MPKKADLSTFVAEDWLAVSTDGFAAMNAGRDPARLVKELVQNALDAIGQESGEVILTCRSSEREKGLLITCQDNGCGMNNLQDIRTVFYTSKTDSHLYRGRMGRGFKEMLCLARWAQVTSGRQRIVFVVEDGQRRTRQQNLPEAIKGTVVEMQMPWEAEVIDCLEDYFQTLLPPAHVRLLVNDELIAPRPGVYHVTASLPTELLEEGRWVRVQRRATIELAATLEAEEPRLFELGIPVCPAEWTQAFHINILQRVPMNPGRDAVASGYLTKVHRACLPALLPQMDEEQIRQDWVGQAAPGCGGAVQQEIIRRGFGQAIARSVPAMGVRQFDEDAREIGLNVIDTRQTSGGFREILQEHVPTTRQAVEQHNQQLAQVAAGSGFCMEELTDCKDSRRRLIDAVGGKHRVQQVIDFAGWFCQQLLEGYQDVSICSVKLAILKPVNAVATWSTDDVLTLGIDTPWLWTEPLGERALSVLIHECAHHLNAHHGRDFHNEVERLGGRAARVMLVNADYVMQEYAQFLSRAASLA